MEMNWKRHLLVAGVACSSLLTSAFAAEGCPPPPKPKPVCDVPCDTPPAGQIGDYKEITPNAGPRVCDGADVFITGTFIWWNTRQEGLGYVASNRNDAADRATNTTTAGISRGSVSHASGNWDPGFKVGLGLNLEHDGWDIYAEYTWLQSSDSSSKTKSTHTDSNTNTNKGLIPMWNVASNFSASTTSITKASADFSNRLNVIDLEMGRNFFTSQYLALRPHWGLKGSWQSQDYSVKYDTLSKDQATNKETTAQYKMKNNQDYWAIGLRTGMDSTWHFNDSFSLFGDFALSALWANYDVDRKDTLDADVALKTDLIQTLYNTENDYSVGKAVLEMEVGFRWETWFSNDDYHFMAQAGWEHQIWFSHNNLLRYFEESAHGDISYMGLSVKLRFDF